MSEVLKEYIKIILKNIDMGLEKNRKDKLIKLAQVIKRNHEQKNIVNASEKISEKEIVLNYKKILLLNEYRNSLISSEPTSSPEYFLDSNDDTLLDALIPRSADINISSSDSSNSLSIFRFLTNFATG